LIDIDIDIKQSIS